MIKCFSENTDERVERWHGKSCFWRGWWFFYSCRDELLNGEIFYALKKAQVLIEELRMEYNTFRLHSSLKYCPPAPEMH